MLLLLLFERTLQESVLEADERTVYVANALADYHMTGCTVLLQPDNATWLEQRRTFRVAKMLSSSFFYSKTTIVKTFQEYMEHVAYRYNSHRCAKMLHILYGQDEKVRNQLEKVGII